MEAQRTRYRVILAVLSVLLIGSVAFNVVALAKTRDKKPESELSRTMVRGVDVANFQAVFLPTGQVYFGKLSLLDKDTYKLTDVYYLKDEGSPLTKLGNEVHKPQDAMYIPKTTISFWENLKDDQQFNGLLH